MKTIGQPKDHLKRGARSNRLPVSVSGQITLLTDFGTSDYYVGAVKGVILSVNPAVTIIDITHNIPPQDIGTAAFTLLASYRSFAKGTIHVAVVDPGVGSARRPIVISADGHLFVGPDNGLFSYVLDQVPEAKVVHVTSIRYFRQPVSSTFHGRDVFAPVAGALSAGVLLEDLGSLIDDPVRLPRLQPRTLRGGAIRGRIIHIDHFGNCITNISRELLSNSNDSTVTLIVKEKRIRAFREFYDQGLKGKGLFAIWGSTGFLEISIAGRSAAKLLKASREDEVTIEFS